MGRDARPKLLAGEFYSRCENCQQSAFVFHIAGMTLCGPCYNDVQRVLVKMADSSSVEYEKEGEK